MAVPLDGVDNPTELFKRYREQGVNPSQVDPVKLRWRNDALRGINHLVIDLGKALTASSVSLGRKAKAKLIAENMPGMPLLAELDYTEVKEIFNYASTAWHQECRESFYRFATKAKQIHFRENCIKVAGDEYGIR